MATTKTPSKSTAAQRKEQQRLAELRRARKNAAAWVDTHHPDYVDTFVQLADLGRRQLRRGIEDMWPNLVASVLAKGRNYAESFIDEVRAQWPWVEMAWSYATYAEGVRDGERWASDIAPADQLNRLCSALRNSGRRILVEIDFKEAELDAAHCLLALILGHDVYPGSDDRTDEDGWEFDSRSEAFKSFWQPFFQEPLDEVLDNLESDGTDAKCKLMEPNYLAGFVDGAAGLSQRLRQAHLA